MFNKDESIPVSTAPFVSGAEGYSSTSFAIKSYEPKSVFIFTFLSSTSISTLVSSGNSPAISKSGCKGIAADPCFSILLSIVVVIVISKSVDRRVTPDSETSINTQLRIGKVDLFGTAFDNFCKAD